jgi:hypothetical protein
MRLDTEREIVSDLARLELNPSQIARATRIPRSTVRDWLRQPERKPTRGRMVRLDATSLPEREYSYLLGFYLGDGAISQYPRGVYKLRISTDGIYPAIVAECVAAVQAVMPRNRVSVNRLPSRAVQIGCYSKAWPLLFPQHGPGRKHMRKIELAPGRLRSLGVSPNSSCGA